MAAISKAFLPKVFLYSLWHISSQTINTWGSRHVWITWHLSCICIVICYTANFTKQKDSHVKHSEATRRRLMPYYDYELETMWSSNEASDLILIPLWKYVHWKRNKSRYQTIMANSKNSEQVLPVMINCLTYNNEEKVTLKEKRIKMLPVNFLQYENWKKT